MFSLSFLILYLLFWGVKNFKNLKLNPTKLKLMLFLSSVADFQLMHPSFLFHC